MRKKLNKQRKPIDVLTEQLQLAFSEYAKAQRSESIKRGLARRKEAKR